MSFSLFQLKYIYDSVSSKFHLPYFDLNLFLGSKNLQALEEDQIQENLSNFGPNKIEIVCPRFPDIFMSKIVSPSTIFNCFLIILSIAEGYRNSVVFSVGLTFVDILVSALNEFTYNLSFKSYETGSTPIKAFRKNAWIDVDSFSLVPGDIVQIGKNLKIILHLLIFK